MAINVFQIFHDDNTRKKLDPAFLPLDNSTAARPDWLEYWPISTVLLNRSFADTDYVGFLSPRFFEKTGFRGVQVTALVERSGAEVVGFSPRHRGARHRGSSKLVWREWTNAFGV